MYFYFLFHYYICVQPPLKANQKGHGFEMTAGRPRPSHLHCCTPGINIYCDVLWHGRSVRKQLPVMQQTPTCINNRTPWLQNHPGHDHLYYTR